MRHTRAAQVTAGGEKSRPFQWPPLPLPAEPPSSQPSAPQPASIPPHDDHRAEAGWRSWLSDVERVWLDPVAQPLPVRERQLGWQPDPAADYCERCGRDVALHEATEFGCSRCTDRRLRWRRWVRLGPYAPPLSGWVCEVKFSRSKRLGLQIGARLGERVRAVLATEPWADAAPAVVVPVPANPWRRLVRGLDHTGVISQGVAGVLGASVGRALRSKPRPSQRGRAASQRRANLRGSMSLRPGWERRLAGSVVVLVDDVSTTGATIGEATRALLAPYTRGSPWAKPELVVATVAVTPDRLEAQEAAFPERDVDEAGDDASAES